MSFNELYNIVKENILSIIIAIYILYEKGYITFIGKNKEDKKEDINKSYNTNNEMRIDILEKISKSNIDDINKKINVINKMLENLSSQTNENRLLLERTKGDLKTHDMSISNTKQRLDELNNILSTIDKSLNNVCVKMAEISSKITEFDKRLTSINDDMILIKRDKLINGDLKDGFR